MSEENEDSLEELAKKKLKKELNEDNETPEQIRKERDTLHAQLSALATKEFEREVIRTATKLAKGDTAKQQEIIEKIGDDVDMLRTFQAQATLEEEDDGTEPVPPSGKAGAPPKEPTKETIAVMYQKLNSNTTTVEEKERINKQLDKYWLDLLRTKKSTFKRALRELSEQ